jgi:hypothetical protein
MTSIESTRIEVAGISVEVLRKRIKHLHVAVYPPEGRVRVAAPLSVSDEAIRLAVIERIPWIRKHQARFAAQPRQSRREMVNGESHWVQGRRYLLALREVSGREGVALRGLATLELSVHPGSDSAHREAVLYRWLRKELKTAIPPLLELWQPILGVDAASWGVRKMKTRWGSCNTSAKRLWFNLELAKKPPECLEYVVVHELAHLIERRHDARFTALMTRHLPGWPRIREALNAAPLADESFRP